MNRLITLTRMASGFLPNGAVVAVTLGFVSMALLALSNPVQAQTKVMYDLTFKPDRFTEQTITHNGKPLTVRAYEKIVYVANPVDTTYQVMNVYVPAEYFAGKSVNGYTAQTAPIFFPNRIGGYMPALPATALNTGGGPGGGMGGPGGPPPGADQNGPGGAPAGVASPGGTPPTGGINRGGGMGGGPRGSAVVVALSKGYVVASAGARGRTSPTGKAPAHIVGRSLPEIQRPHDARRRQQNHLQRHERGRCLVDATGRNRQQP